MVIDRVHDERVQLNAARVSERFIQRIPRDFARRHLIVSQGDATDGDEGELLAVSARTPPSVVFNTGVRLGRAVRTFVADDERIASAIDAAYSRNGRREAKYDGDTTGGGGGDGEAQLDLSRLIEAADRDLLATEGKAPVVRLVDALLFEALSRGASDVHVQPVEDGAIVRYRLDGVLHAVRETPKHTALAVVNRIKVMARCDVAEQRVPQDGRASVTISGRPVDLRISILPTSYGERAVVRLLDRTRQLAEFDRLGMTQPIADRFMRHARAAHGVILVTGPTGSGKTTTLYATLQKILERKSVSHNGSSGAGGAEGLNILTIEDPIEYDLSESIRNRTTRIARGSSISQSQVNLKKGVTFANGLRHILRQDPDVIMVGEIRDAETARMAIQASLTGHLVFSTLHTNDACSAVTRLIDLGVEPYLVAASLSAVLAQRLVRLIHQSCDGAGCDECLHTGFAGRSGIFELLSVDENVRRLISHGGTLAEIRAAAAENGLVTLYEDAQRLLEARLSKPEEVARVVEGAA